MEEEEYGVEGECEADDIALVSCPFTFPYRTPLPIPPSPDCCKYGIERMEDVSEPGAVDGRRGLVVLPFLVSCSYACDLAAEAAAVPPPIMLILLLVEVFL